MIHGTLIADGNCRILLGNMNIWDELGIDEVSQGEKSLQSEVGLVNWLASPFRI